MFSNGRFAFDEVYAFEREGDRLWLASDGGVCLYSYADFQPERFVARAFIDAESERSAPSAGLARVREIVRDPARPSSIVSRTASGAVLELHRAALSFAPRQATPDGEAPSEEVFTRAYTREHVSAPHYQMRWGQYPFGSVPHPEGALQVFVATASGHTVSLGAERAGVDLPLLSQNRFAFDDVRAVVLHGTSLLAATPIGVVEHMVDWTQQQAQLDRFHSVAGSPQDASPRLMKGLQRLVQFPNGSIMAWGGDPVFDARFGDGEEDVLYWQVNPSLRVEQIGPEMILADTRESWQLWAYQPSSKRPMKVTRVVDTKPVVTEEVHSRFQPVDVSVAVMDTNWLYLPDPRGGLFRIRKRDVQ